MVNAVVVAHLLGVTLVLPRLDLIGRGNERFEPANASYVAPYSQSRDRWGIFNHLFNSSRAVSMLRKRGLSVQPRLRAGAGLRTVSLPSVEVVVPGCDGQYHQQGTCEAEPRDQTLLLRLVARWRVLVDAECPMGMAASRSVEMDGPQVVFDAGLSLCWNAYKSRFADVCKAQFGICAAVLGALTWNRVITRLQSRILRGIARLAEAATAHLSLVGGGRLPSRPVSDANRSFPAWAGVHVRAFVCAQNQREPSFGHVLRTLQRNGVHGGLLYLVSSVPPAQVQRALPSFRVLSKADFLGGDVRLAYPFEVLAAVDYGVAVRAPLYLGEPKSSSFDAFATEERVREGMSPVQPMQGACSRRLGLPSFHG